MPSARQDVFANKLPNGDGRRKRGDAANEVIVTCRDQAQQRVENTRD